jgi:hypothetical protein
MDFIVFPHIIPYIDEGHILPQVWMWWMTNGEKEIFNVRYLCFPIYVWFLVMKVKHFALNVRTVNYFQIGSRFSFLAYKIYIYTYIKIKLFYVWEKSNLNANFLHFVASFAPDIILMIFMKHIFSFWNNLTISRVCLTII